MPRLTLVPAVAGEDVARTSCVRVGLVKSSYKEISSNILQPTIVNSAYNTSKTRVCVYVCVCMCVCVCVLACL